MLCYCNSSRGSLVCFKYRINYIPMSISKMNEDVVNYIKSLGVGCRSPKDEFFRAGDEINKVHKIFGVLQVDDEEFYHKSYSMSCHIPGCTFTCDTIYDYDQHYNSCHRFSCSQCNKYLPSSHLLDLHLMETHDAYFAAMAEKKAMFQCYLQECKQLFTTPQQRKDHCIKDHKFPSNFRFDALQKKNGQVKSRKKNEKKKQAQDAEMVEDPEQNMEVEATEGIDKPKPKPKTKAVRNIKPGKVRKPVLDMDCFVKDLKESLPS